MYEKDNQYRNTGIFCFERARLFFVDKTNFIKEWWENRDVVTLITRPRRFGKTFAAVKAGNLKDAKNQIKQEIARLYEENRYLLESNVLSDNERKIYNSTTPQESYHPFG